MFMMQSRSHCIAFPFVRGWWGGSGGRDSERIRRGLNGITIPLAQRYSLRSVAFVIRVLQVGRRKKRICGIGGWCTGKQQALLWKQLLARKMSTMMMMMVSFIAFKCTWSVFVRSRLCTALHGESWRFTTARVFKWFNGNGWIKKKSACGGKPTMSSGWAAMQFHFCCEDIAGWALSQKWKMSAMMGNVPVCN